MAGRYDITPLDTSTRQKMLGQFDQLSNQVLSQQDIEQLMGQYGRVEDQGLQQANDAAMLQLSQQYSPAFEALRARNYGLYGGGPGIGRDYSNLMSQSIGNLTGQRLGLGAESAGRKAAMLRALAQQRISGRQAMGGQLWDRMLNTKKTPSTGQQIMGAGLQLAGAGIGALAGGPGGAVAGAAAMSPHQQAQDYRGQIESPANIDWYDQQAQQQSRSYQPRSMYTNYAGMR